MNKNFITDKLEDLNLVSKYLAELSKTYNHFCFYGEMGAGKTTLINLICKNLGVTEHTSSPTYSIINEYIAESDLKINHFDLFRIKDEFELLDIGIEEILDSAIICFIEWPEKVLRFLSNEYVEINIETKNEKREINISIIS